MGEVRYKRGGRLRGLKLRESHPNESAARYADSERRKRSSFRRPVSEEEPRAINCAQCGQHIEDHAAVSECPFCGGDNFLGRPVRNY